MPPAKTWHFKPSSLRAGASIVVLTADGTQLKKGRGKKFGAIREISNGGDDVQKGNLTKKENIIKVKLFT